MKILTVSSDVSRVAVVRQHHISVVDKEGNQQYDRCGRPLYKTVNEPDYSYSYTPNYFVEDGDEQFWLTEKEFKRQYGNKKLRKLVREYRQFKKEEGND